MNNPYNINRGDPKCEEFIQRTLEISNQYSLKCSNEYKEPTRENYIKNGVDPDFMESLAANDHLRIIYFESSNKSITNNE